MKGWWAYSIMCSALLILELSANAQEIVINPTFETVGNFHKGVAPAFRDKLWGLIDRHGEWMVQPTFAGIGIGNNGLFPVQKDGVWGYVNSTGQFVIAAKFEAAEPFDNQLAAVKLEGRWFYLRADGSTENELKFLEIGGREGDYISARDSEGWAVFKILKDGNYKREGFPRELRRAYSVAERTIIGKFDDGERLFLIDYSSGESDDYSLWERFPRWSDKYELTSILRMSEGFAPAATAANKWGYLHKASGEYLWQGRFEGALGFARGLAPVKSRGKWGYIDRTGRVVIEARYDAAFPFRGDYAVVRLGEKRGFLRLNQEGGVSTFVVPQYEDALRFTEGLAPVKVNGRWGFVSNGQPWSDLVDTGIVDILPR